MIEFGIFQRWKLFHSSYAVDMMINRNNLLKMYIKYYIASCVLSVACSILTGDCVWVLVFCVGDCDWVLGFYVDDSVWVLAFCVWVLVFCFGDCVWVLAFCVWFLDYWVGDCVWNLFFCVSDCVWDLVICVRWQIRLFAELGLRQLVNVAKSDNTTLITH